jgi:hypothetical protein
MQRNKRKPEIKYPEIAVFALSKGSQMNEHSVKNECYFFMLNKLEQMMSMNNVKSNKVGISGYKEDVAAYLSFYFEIYQNRNFQINLMEDINEYDPDILPDKFQ